MINLTTLYGGSSASDGLRYGSSMHGRSADAASASQRRPVVVWTMSRRCNLHCVHCYSDSSDQQFPGELSVGESRRMLGDLARFGIPALLLSGGEPLLHPHFFELAEFARAQGLRLTLSTNGTLMTAQTARRIKGLGFTYVGISFDGLGKMHDQFRGRRGAFEAALAGVRNLKAVGQRVGLRFTLTRRNVEALPEIAALVEQEQIDRVCFYHLVYSGRGGRLAAETLSHEETRRVMNCLCLWAKAASAGSHPVEILTVDNHVDGVYVYLKLLAEDPLEAELVRRRLAWNGGGANASGVGIANIDARGNVHPDQFWQEAMLGNVRERPFSEIWTDATQPLLAALRDRLPKLTGRCAQCRWASLCGGSFRVRALQATGDPWAPDPACYLTDEEIT